MGSRARTAWWDRNGRLGVATRDTGKKHSPVCWRVASTTEEVVKTELLSQYGHQVHSVHSHEGRLCERKGVEGGNCLPRGYGRMRSASRRFKT